MSMKHCTMYTSLYTRKCVECQLNDKIYSNKFIWFDKRHTMTWHTIIMICVRSSLLVEQRDTLTPFLFPFLSFSIHILCCSGFIIIITIIIAMDYSPPNGRPTNTHCCCGCAWVRCETIWCAVNLMRRVYEWEKENARAYNYVCCGHKFFAQILSRTWSTLCRCSVAVHLIK